MLRQEIYALDGTEPRQTASLQRHRAELHRRAPAARGGQSARGLLRPSARSDRFPLRAQAYERQSAGRPARQPRADAGSGRLRQRAASQSPSATAAATTTPTRLPTVGPSRSRALHAHHVHREPLHQPRSTSRTTTARPCRARRAPIELLKARPSRRDRTGSVTNLSGSNELDDVVAAVGDGSHDLPYEDWRR